MIMKRSPVVRTQPKVPDIKASVYSQNKTHVLSKMYQKKFIEKRDKKASSNMRNSNTRVISSREDS